MLFLILMVSILLGVAFITLLERKFLGYLHFRKGPSKVGFKGLFQPFSDAIKLFMKEVYYLFLSNLFLFMFFPLLSIILMLMFWRLYVWENSSYSLLGLVYMILISSLGVYVILGSGWVSNSKYALLGSYRGVAQTISYEVSMSFILCLVMIINSSYNLKEFMEVEIKFMMIWILSIMGMMMWLVTVIAELNRSPFDFSEGESELVSGFNVEYGAGFFALLFISEYGNIFFICYLTSVMFFGGSFIFMLILIISVIWIRGSYPRFRYDNLMMLVWKIILPLSLLMFMLFINKVYIM